jgi:hypothetical protein
MELILANSWNVSIVAFTTISPNCRIARERSDKTAIS